MTVAEQHRYTDQTLMDELYETEKPLSPSALLSRVTGDPVSQLDDQDIEYVDTFLSQQRAQNKLRNGIVEPQQGPEQTEYEITRRKEDGVYKYGIDDLSQ